jgi:hypothetical protein
MDLDEAWDLRVLHAASHPREVHLLAHQGEHEASSASAPTLGADVEIGHYHLSIRNLQRLILLVTHYTVYAVPIRMSPPSPHLILDEVVPLDVGHEGGVEPCEEVAWPPHALGHVGRQHEGLQVREQQPDRLVAHQPEAVVPRDVAATPPPTHHTRRSVISQQKAHHTLHRVQRKRC